MVGINAALNVYRISMRDAVQLSFRIVMVLMFGLTWSNFTQIYEAASNGLSALALEYFRLGGSGVGASATAAMDDMANMMAGNVDSVSSAMSSIMRGFVAAVLYVVLGVLMAVYVFIVGFSKLMIAFLLGVAPIAIGATIFEKTKGIFEAWLSAMIGYLMYPVASAGVIVAVVTVAHDVFRNADAVTDLGSILGFFVIVFVGIFALMAIPNAVTHVTGQISLASIAPQALRVAGKPLEKASDYSAADERVPLGLHARQDRTPPFARSGAVRCRARPSRKGAFGSIHPRQLTLTNWPTPHNCRPRKSPFPEQDDDRFTP
jgi:type IV secretion system protein VirB6